MDIQCRVIQFLGEQSGTSKAGNPWKKKEWLVETFGQYPKKIKVQCFGDRADSMNLEPGKDYTLYVDLESREFNGRWFTDVSVYRYEDYTGGSVQPPQQPGPGTWGTQPAPVNQTGDFQQPFVSEGAPASDEDLPF